MTELPRQCRFCALLKEVQHPLLGEEGYYRCSTGRFDFPMPSGGTVPQSFAWSGIWRPNKKVAVAQEDCPCFEQHPQAVFISKKYRPQSIETFPEVQGEEPLTPASITKGRGNYKVFSW